jgi:hypothetical protein
MSVENFLTDWASIKEDSTQFWLYHVSVKYSLTMELSVKRETFLLTDDVRRGPVSKRVSLS